MYRARQMNKSIVVTLPKYMTEIVKIKAGDDLIFELQGKKIIIRKGGNENE